MTNPSGKGQSAGYPNKPKAAMRGRDLQKSSGLLEAIIAGGDINNLKKSRKSITYESIQHMNRKLATGPI